MWEDVSRLCILHFLSEKNFESSYSLLHAVGATMVYAGCSFRSSLMFRFCILFFFSLSQGPRATRLALALLHASVCRHSSLLKCLRFTPTGTLMHGAAWIGGFPLQNGVRVSVALSFRCSFHLFFPFSSNLFLSLFSLLPRSSCPFSFFSLSFPFCSLSFASLFLLLSSSFSL